MPGPIQLGILLGLAIGIWVALSTFLKKQ